MPRCGGQKPTVFPSRRFGDEVFGIQSTENKHKSNGDSDKIRRHELPANGGIVVRRGADEGSRHVASPASSISSLVSKGRRRKLRLIDWI